MKADKTFSSASELKKYLQSQSPMAAKVDRDALIAHWRHLARKELEIAAREGSTLGKRIIEHGAMIYINCIIELKQGPPLMRQGALITLLEPQKSRLRLFLERLKMLFSIACLLLLPDRNPDLPRSNHES